MDDAQIEYEVQGDGEPVLLIPLSVIIDGLAHPLFKQPELADRYRLIHYRRRGWTGSTRGHAALTMAREACDAAALLRHLGVSRAHIAGHSIGGLIALQLALDAPELVHSLALLEPPLRMGSGGKESYERINLPMLNAYQSGDKRRAVEIFADPVFGPNWQPVVEQAVPGGVEQAIKDADTFMEEQATIQEWQFGPAQAAAIRQPVLSVLGARSTPFMKKGREMLHAWLPQTEDLDLDTTHLLQMQDPEGVARGLVTFFGRHPMRS